ncbi:MULTISPECIES: hypothetical protein [Streptomyces]|uniref:Guanylate cyclase domain-containing protein n=2 Tax=Streptomyces TaxID=1883 RepID=A0A3R7EW56_9ACTN|nr:MULTISPECIES: hypothetical protein [Streptomyces]KNE79204.1 hypothetical protein ADZ36_28875 [Streptomyces fradiae]OFA39223.1 hypothetical protein BEN35_27000 [Streptomyces fradiae]PQM22879.1 hypothetical protein Sfr7A_14450 [Streptomyces xinghaiensis]RKM97352.1 hypothetical protein SFRA_009050 [Streptomyces xinghaiensis]RNC73813.1 hypothetical protein DC095_013090 [Streptomyces xinghaiensis]
MNTAGAVNRLVVFGDACGSGKLGMHAKRRMRDGMYAAFAEAYASVDIEPGRLHQEDRGDGILTALDPAVPPSLMVGRWADTLYQCLREHNAGSAERLRLRVGMNAGPVMNDGRGLVGRAVDLACRLCDSPVAKDIMAGTPGADLLLVVSDWLYENVVAEGGRYVEPEHYRSARVRSKETDETAWFHIPRSPAPEIPRTPGPSRPPAAGPPPEPPPGDGPAEGGDGAGGRGDGDGGPPESGDGAPGGRRITARGDLLYFENNVINGGFTGIRREAAGGAARGRETDAARNTGDGA